MFRFAGLQRTALSRVQTRFLSSGSKSTRMASTLHWGGMQFNSLPHRRFTTTPIDASDTAMFCRQCEQTQDNVACTSVGVCGKEPGTAVLQDALMAVVRSVAGVCVTARAVGVEIEDLKEANEWTLRATFSTLTNVNFSEDRMVKYIEEGVRIRFGLEGAVRGKGGLVPAVEADILKGDGPEPTAQDWKDYGRDVGVLARQEKMGSPDAFSLNEIASYALKGVCAYAAHASQLGLVDDVNIMAPVHEVFAKLTSDEADVEGLLECVHRVGKINAATMALLDEAHALRFGTPEPTKVRMSPVEGKAILVSGHDLGDLESLLVQTAGKGINIYTHGEMLPAHGYPELKKHKHLVGNYGTAWQNQKFEFGIFPGPVLMTTNCIVEPRRNYIDRIWTVNEVGFDKVKHIADGRDFTPIIEQALSMDGFKGPHPEKFHTVGFNHRVVVPMAGQLLDAVKAGQVSRVFLIGGCDGAESERSYFTELAEKTPDDSLILTLGCAKNRILKSDRLLNATLPNGLPRVLDMGQCNDSYSAVVVATQLAEALKCSVNDLPLSLALSHLEQKAAAVLSTLLYLGVKNIRLGPTLPAFITPNIFKVLSDTYNLMPTGDVDSDLASMMKGQ